MAHICVRIKRAPLDGKSLAEILHHMAEEVSKMKEVKRTKMEGPEGGLIGWLEVYK